MTNKFMRITKILKKGGIITYPTETCYGIGADATNQQAVTKIYKIKKRKTHMPLIVLFSSKKMAEKYVHLNKPAKLLMKKFMPVPLTLIAKKKKMTFFESHLSCQGKKYYTFLNNRITKSSAEDLVIGSNLTERNKTRSIETIAFRISSHSFVRQLFKYYNKPLISTSANISGKPEPYNIKDIDKKILASADVIVDYGRLRKTKPSTIFNTLTLEIERKGPISKSVIKKIMENRIKKVLCGGAFNHIHKGHIYFLRKAKSLGDHLSVVVSNDARNSKKYGNKAVPAIERKQALEKLGIADNVIIGQKENILNTLKKEQPNIIALGYDQPQLPNHIKKKYKIIRIGEHEKKI
ncbi:MAG: Sua5/YciO/YrdC/YwlC family protein [Candidatus Aenigmarchaeota archaeon]|nr:Sua5/YciO/YrdC/YwlC family protein [Candidatus Aenigmarchaeota archaeon]